MTITKLKFIDLSNVTKIVNTNETIRTKKVTQDSNELLIETKLSFDLIEATTIVIKRN